MTEPTTTPDPLIGRTVRAYEIEEQIGISRWGKVYRAIQKSTNRIVAVRILSPSPSTPRWMLSRSTSASC